MLARLELSCDFHLCASPPILVRCCIRAAVAHPVGAHRVWRLFSSPAHLGTAAAGYSADQQMSGGLQVQASALAPMESGCCTASAVRGGSAPRAWSSDIPKNPRNVLYRSAAGIPCARHRQVRCRWLEGGFDSTRSIREKRRKQGISKAPFSMSGRADGRAAGPESGAPFSARQEPDTRCLGQTVASGLHLSARRCVGARRLVGALAAGGCSAGPAGCLRGSGGCTAMSCCGFAVHGRRYGVSGLAGRRSLRRRWSPPRETRQCWNAAVAVRPPPRSPYSSGLPQPPKASRKIRSVFGCRVRVAVLLFVSGSVIGEPTTAVAELPMAPLLFNANVPLTV